MSEAATVSPAKAAPTIRVESLQLDLLAPDQNQIRKHFDEAALQSLADSIRENGLIQPIVVRAAADGDRADYRIIAGERRYRAARLAGIEHVPVIVRDDLAGADITVIQVLENLQREDLTLAETCTGVAKLVEQLGFAKTCEQLGKSEAWVSKHAGVLKLPEAIRKLVGEGKIDSVDVAKELGTLMEIAPKKAGEIVRRLDPTAAPHDASDDPIDDEEEEPSGDDAIVWTERGRARWGDLTEEQREAYRLRSEREPRTVTRSEVRLEVLDAKAAQQRKEESKDAKSAEKAALKNDPKAAKKSAAEKNKKDRERERVKAIELHNEAASALSHTFTRKLNVAAGFKEPTRDQYHWKGDPRIEVRADHVSAYGNTRAPASPSTAHYHVEADGTFAEIQAIANLLDPEPKLDVRFHGELTIVEARKIADVLGSRVRFGMRLKRIGTQLEALTQIAATPAKVKAASEPNGDVHAFLVATVIKAATHAHRIKAGDLHALYVIWCKKNKATPVPLNSNEWGDAIADAGIGKIRSQGIKYTHVKLREVKG